MNLALRWIIRLFLGAHSFSEDMLSESGLTFPLKLLHVIDQPCIAIHLKFVVLYHLFLFLLVFVHLFVDQLVNFRDICGCFIAQF